ncbi:hypothetical protein BpHYR1_023821 [Brachionus plicatilis]|uniref:RNA-directed DNA polymerase from mobile element jockey-like n=1 Tax=Brachionus plicatilis TaxID=10195 RepID=A0A3M7PXI6_BRAPC|nr:hypothetical protein BpHYR1_023821 [Brachionus plicatilis]
MFVSNKKNLTFPKWVTIDSNDIEVVNCFKLLGITIDNKLTFLKYVSDLRTSINKRSDYNFSNLFYYRTLIIDLELNYNLFCHRIENNINNIFPHIISRGGKWVKKKFRENWVTIFEVFEQNGCEIRNKKKIGHPKTTN